MAERPELRGYIAPEFVTSWGEIIPEQVILDNPAISALDENGQLSVDWINAMLPPWLYVDNGKHQGHKLGFRMEDMVRETPEQKARRLKETKLFKDRYNNTDEVLKSLRPGRRPGRKKK